MSTADATPPGDEPGDRPHDGPHDRAHRGFTAELRDAVGWRAFGLVLGGLLIQVGFIVSYVGAFHSPAPHRIPVAVVAPATVAGQVVDQLDGLPGDPVTAETVSDEATARRQVLDRTVDAAVLVDPTGRSDRLLVASAGGPSVAQTAAQIAQSVERARHRQVTVTDIRPPAPGDGRGMGSFYLVLGWVVGGYLTASIIGIAGGARPANPHRTVIRLGALAAYSVVSGLAGAIVVDPVFSTLTGHFSALWALGALIVFAAAATATALQILFGLVGVGLAIVLFVVLGNPSSGGVYPASLLPPFWSAIGPLLPPGAGTTAVRNTVYFQGHATSGALWVLAGYALGGILVSLAASPWRGRATRSTEVAGAPTPG